MSEGRGVVRTGVGRELFGKFRGLLTRLSWSRDPVLLATIFLFLPVVLDESRLRAIGGHFAFAVLALSLGWVWGHGGILSFGQGAFFGIGAYSAALGLARWEFPLASAVGFVAGILAAAFIALLLGWFVFQARLGTFYVAVFTLALSVVFQQLALQFSDITGGANGIVIPAPIYPDSPLGAYYVMYSIFCAILFLLVWAARSDFGRVLVAIRDNEERARFLGYDTARVQRWAFALGGAVAAVGGAMYAPYIQLASPDLIGFVFSSLVLIWVAIGGRRYLAGAAAGALLVNIAQLELGATLLLYWQVVLGALFVATILLAPDGLYFIVKRFAERGKSSERLHVRTRRWMLHETSLTASSTDSPILRVSGVTKNYGSFRALHGVGFDIARGELRCLIGPNGSGKSTLVDVLTGRTAALRGEAVLVDSDILGQSAARIASAGVRRKFQATNVFDTLSVSENLSLAGTATDVTLRSFLGRSPELWLPEPIVGLLHEGGVWKRLSDQAGELSHGEKQWLELCMVLAGEPRLVLLDEPTAGLTPEERREIGGVLRGLTTQGLTILLIEHDFDFVREVADRVTVLHQGRVIADGAVADVSENQAVRDVYLGTSTLR